MQITVHFEDRDWTFDPQRPSYQQAMAIQLDTGLSMSEWENALDVQEKTGPDGEPTGELEDPGIKWIQCVGSLYWLMHNQNGDKFPLATMDFDVYEFLEAFGQAMQDVLVRIRAEKKAADEAKAAAPDPTSQERTAEPSPPISPTSGTRPDTTPTPRNRPEEDALSTV